MSARVLFELGNHSCMDKQTAGYKFLHDWLVMLASDLPYSTKHLRAKTFVDFAVFALLNHECFSVNVFPQILKCFGTCGRCFDANAKVFLRILTW